MKQFLALLLTSLLPLHGAVLTDGILAASDTSGTNATVRSVTITARTNLNAGVLNATNDIRLAGNSIITALTNKGDFSGPSSSTNNNLVSFNGTTGKTGKDSGIATDGSGAITTPGNITIGTIATPKRLIIPSGDSTRSWSFTPFSSIFSGTTDYIGVLGYNIDASGNVSDPTKSALNLNFESDYSEAPGTTNSEIHFTITLPGLGSRRPYMATRDHVTGNVNNFLKGTTYLTDESGNEIFTVGTANGIRSSLPIRFVTNNTPAIMQMDTNALMTTIMYLDNLNRVVIAGSGNKTAFGGEASAPKMSTISGDFVVPNGNNLSSTNAAGSGTIKLIGSASASDIVVISPDATTIRIDGNVTTASPLTYNGTNKPFMALSTKSTSTANATFSSAKFQHDFAPASAASGNATAVVGQIDSSTANRPAVMTGFNASVNASASGGTISTAQGYGSSPSATGGSTISSFYHFKVTDIFNSSSTVSAQYGFYAPAMTGGTANHAFYSAGTNTPSYFAGPISARLYANATVAPTLASASTIAPTTAVTFVSGTTAIDTITAPSPISSTGGQITLIPTGIFTTTTSGNIALASTAVVSKALIMTYDQATAKWYPSY